MIAAINIPAMLAEGKRLQAIENRRSLVRAFSAAHEVFAEYSRQGRLLIVPPLGKIVPCFDTRTSTGRLIMLARCGMVTTAGAYMRQWFRDGRPARSKARCKFKGHMITDRRQARELVKPADRRARNVRS